MADAFDPSPFIPVTPKRTANPPTRESSRSFAPYRKTSDPSQFRGMYKTWFDSLVWNDQYYWNE